MNKYNVIWKGCRPSGILEIVSEPWTGDPTRDEYYEETECFGGVMEVKSLDKLDEWWSRMSVSFGEDRGFFKIFGGWTGVFKDLKEGKTYFKTEKELALEIDMFRRNETHER